jgi:hypothetical protein
MGLFNCTPGGSTATTTLSGQYFKVNDNCGPVSQSVSCDNDLDLTGSAGTGATSRQAPARAIRTPREPAITT